MEKYLRTAEVSAKTGVPVATLRWWRHRGDRGPRSGRLEGIVVYKESDVLAWIDQQLAATSVGGTESA